MQDVQCELKISLISYNRNTLFDEKEVTTLKLGVNMETWSRVFKLFHAQLN